VDLPAPADDSARLSPSNHLPVVPAVRSPGLPGSRSAGYGFGENLQVAPHLPRPLPAPPCRFPSRPESAACGAASGFSPSGLPRLPCPLANHFCWFELPLASVGGWIDDESPADCELCIPGAQPRMNLHALPGPACPALAGLAASTPSDAGPKLAPWAKCLTAWMLPLPAGADLLSVPLQGHHLIRDSAPARSVETSANLRNFCGFHHSQCIC